MADFWGYMYMYMYLGYGCPVMCQVGVASHVWEWHAAAASGSRVLFVSS